MKKIYLTLLGTVFALEASADFEFSMRVGEWQVDSVYIVDTFLNQVVGTRVFEYNSDGTIAVDYTTSREYDSFLEMYVTERTKAVSSYDNGLLVKEEYFRQKGNDWVIMSMYEWLDYDANGHAYTIIYYEADDDDEGQMLPTTKWVVTKSVGSYLADFEVFQYDFGQWEPYSKTVSEVNEKGQITKQTCTTQGVGVEYVSTTTYEYDEHGNTTKKVTTSDSGTSENTFEIVYDANGNISTVSEFVDGTAYCPLYFFWSKGGKTAIRSPKQLQNTAPWYDLSGRRLNGQPTQKGIFIHNGKKVYNK